MRAKHTVEPIKKKWLTTQEACEYLGGCSRDFLENLRENAEITFAQVGRMYFHELASIDRMFERHKVVSKN
jgi:excisionase family DNA binding protein